MPVATMSALQVSSLPSARQTMIESPAVRMLVASVARKISAPRRRTCVTARRARSPPAMPLGKPR